jgi:hypothetical protein
MRSCGESKQKWRTALGKVSTRRVLNRAPKKLLSAVGSKEDVWNPGTKKRGYAQTVVPAISIRRIFQELRIKSDEKSSVAKSRRSQPSLPGYANLDFGRHFPANHPQEGLLEDDARPSSVPGNRFNWWHVNSVVTIRAVS